ncbi:MAG: hypothetical protein JWR33_2469 [Naasia sp.]|uniref:PRC and DUF2382 domain-containing protein n=1 Tax=Naasia sp. TaxID=2546198 RepID=UPI00260CB60F|nr:PRC and DUF2382 domain-containing protein [Naasia sp.]MCU1571728.1 hypothetical protein [Naasia sp.]
MIGTENVDALSGATVVGANGDKIGTVGQVYVDATDGHPSWVSVRTGLFGSSESFVPLDEATSEGDTIRVGFDKAMVKDAPRIDNDGALSPEDEDELYRYYGIGSSQTSTHSGYDANAGTAGTAGFAGTTGNAAGTTGYDTSGPTTDSAMTRSEERLHVGTEQVQTGRARLRKYVVTEQQTVSVPVSREEVRLEREPITDANVGDALSGPAISEEEHEVILTEERPVIAKETVPVERVRLDTQTVTENQTVTDDVRKEQIELEGDQGRSGNSRL